MNALGRRNPVAAAVAPNHPRVLAELTASGPSIAGGGVDKAAIDAARALTRRAPLAAEPFMIHGIVALEKGNARDAEARLVEARHRNPRLRGARFALLELYLRQDRIPAASVELSVLGRLVPHLEAVVVPQLAQLVRDRRNGAALLGFFDRNPNLLNGVLATLVENGSDPELILSLTPERMSGSAPWQQALVSRLVEDKQLARAYSLWARFLGVPASPVEKGVYDGAFRGLPGRPPFGWALEATEAGVAEVSNGELEVQFFARETVNLASQLLMLGRGQHRLQFQVDGQASGSDGGLVWRIQCNGSQAILAEAPLREIGSAAQQFSVTFGVPAGCEGQWLRLIGQPGDIPQLQAVTVRDLEVTRG